MLKSTILTGINGQLVQLYYSVLLKDFKMIKVANVDLPLGILFNE